MVVKLLCIVQEREMVVAVVEFTITSGLTGTEPSGFMIIIGQIQLMQ